VIIWLFCAYRRAGSLGILSAKKTAQALPFSLFIEVIFDDFCRLSS
jgi:hypothetical protein